MTMHIEPDLIGDDDDLDGLYRPDPDPITDALGATGFVDRYTLDECVERFEETRAARFPETFDRYYFDGDHGRVLIDVLQDSTSEQLAEERLRKHVAFKTAWCAEHPTFRYLPLPASDADAAAIRRLLDGSPAPKVSQPASQRPKTAATRGQIQRPKAAA
jgi:hypothetical protein